MDITQPEPTIKIDEAALKNVEDFTYFGSCLSSSGGLDTEISCRLCKASSTFGRLWTRVWRKRGITQATKLAVCRAVVLPTSLYGCETGTCYHRHLTKLDKVPPPLPPQAPGHFLGGQSHQRGGISLFRRARC